MSQLDTAWLVSEALRAASEGWRVFPTIPGDRMPRKGFSWKNDSSSDIEKVKQWWAKWPNSNVGAALKPGWFKVDCDVGSVDGVKWFQQSPFWAPTRSVATPSGGVHYIYQIDPAIRVKNRVNRFPGCDIVGVRGTIIFAGFRNGGRYVCDWAEIQPANAHLVKALTPKPEKAVTPTMVGDHGAVGQWLQYCCLVCRDIETAPKSQRNDTLNRTAYRLALLGLRRNISPVVIYDQLIRSGCTAGLMARECRATVKSAFRAAEAALATRGKPAP